ncbi:MAG: hypothetical protein IJM69_04805 [Firmicutes bacterium]|nr:hypothetical protein [Bacillota bacterium]
MRKRALLVATSISLVVLLLCGCGLNVLPRQHRNQDDTTSLEPAADPNAGQAEQEEDEEAEQVVSDEVTMPEAPIQIESKNIISARVEFDDSQQGHHYFYLIKLDDTVRCVVEDDMNHEDFEAPLSVLSDLQKVIDEYNMASKNGYTATTRGIPAGYGYELTVIYDSGEAIRSYDNAFPGFTAEEGDALADFMMSIERIDWPEFTITSEDLSADGSWDVSVTQFEEGQNLSPQLAWEPVEGASEYAVFMFCPSLANSMYMREMNVTEPFLEKGACEEYSGMSHRYGTRRFDVYVYALKAAPDTTPGTFGDINTYMSVIERELDTSGGERGNILARGVLSGRCAGSER